MPDPDLEALMREYDAEVAAYQRLPKSEPTALLDRAVLTKARAAVAHTHRAPRWLGLAASFAGIAIAAGIGWRVHEASQSARDSAGQAATPRPQAFEVQVLPSGTRDRQKAIEMGQLPPAPPAAPQPPMLAKEAEAFADDAAKQELAEPVIEEQAAAAPLRDSDPEPHVRSDHATRGGAPEQRRNMAAPASTATASAPAAVAAESADSAFREDEGKSLRAAERSELDALGAVRAGKDDARNQDSAEAWLERVRRLVRDRRISEARIELQRFRSAYPQVEIPSDLRRYAR